MVKSMINVVKNYKLVIILGGFSGRIQDSVISGVKQSTNAFTSRVNKPYTLHNIDRVVMRKLFERNIT